MAKNFQKAERYVKQGEEYKLLSYATSSKSVEMPVPESNSSETLYLSLYCSTLPL